MAIISKKYAHLNTSDSGSLHKKLDATEAYVTGSLYAGQDATLAAKLMVTGEITGSSNLYLDGAAKLHGAVQMDSTLAVSDKASFGDTTVLEAALVSFGGMAVDIAVEGNVAAGGMLAVLGDAMIEGKLSVGADADIQGLTTHSGSVIPFSDLDYDLGEPAKRWDNIYVGSMQALTVSAEVLSASVDADLNGTLHVAGVSTLAEITGSAGAKFTAGDLKVEAGEVSASSDLKAGGNLVVALDADLNGALDVALASDLHGAVTAHTTFNAKGAADLDLSLIHISEPTRQP
jgi:cytoskeletal protein CcmA (bactofilin family)